MTEGRHGNTARHWGDFTYWNYLVILQSNKFEILGPSLSVIRTNHITDKEHYSLSLVLIRPGIRSAGDSELGEQVEFVVRHHLAGTEELVVLADGVTVLSQLPHEVQVAVLCAASDRGTV